MKQHKGLRLSNEVLEDIEIRSRDDFNFSEWVESTYIKKFMTPEGLEKELKILKNKIKSTKKQLLLYKENQQKRLLIYKENLKKEQKDMLKISKNLIKTRPELLNGRIKLYNNTFNENLTKYKFKEILEVI